MTGYRWGADPTVFIFDIDVAADASADYYDLVFAVAGKLTCSVVNCKLFCHAWPA